MALTLFGVPKYALVRIGVAGATGVVGVTGVTGVVGVTGGTGVVGRTGVTGAAPEAV